MPEGPIVFAYDGSDHAKSAIRQAAELLDTKRSAVVLTVWQPFGSVPFFGGAATPALSKEVVEAVAKEAASVASEGVELAASVGFEAEPVAVEGPSAWHRIVEAADQRDAAIVVLGSHGRSGLGYATMGSIATSVAHHIDRPVLITRLV
jgi:nucleotide-binding universal stress UspA family protein